MRILQDLKYSREHQWVKVEGNKARVGITDFAQSQLGDVVFIKVPTVGDNVTAGESFSVVESVKVVSDIYAPVSGVIFAVNRALNDTPENVNIDAYGEGWIAVIEMSNPVELESLMNSDTYRESTAKEGHSLC